MGGVERAGRVGGKCKLREVPGRKYPAAPREGGTHPASGSAPFAPRRYGDSVIRTRNEDFCNNFFLRHTIKFVNNEHRSFEIMLIMLIQ